MVDVTKANITDETRLVQPNLPNDGDNKVLEKQKPRGMRKTVVCRFFKKACLVLVGYIVCYLNWSITLPIIAVATYVWYETQTSEKGEKISKKFKACSMSKQDVANAMKDLPSWVNFPDRERAEWLNEIISQLWPSISSYIIKFCRGTLQAKLRKKYGSFRFEDIDFGQAPPKIDGVKVYNKSISKDSIIIDFDVFYDGDCDINISISGAQIGRIKDFQMGVEIRVILKPILIKTPIVGGMQIFFLNTPDINFDLEGISCIPGFSYFARQKIEEQITKKLVFPNKITKRFTKSIEASELKSLEPEGVLRVHVFEAKELEKKDVTGRSDPYVVLNVGAQEYKTQVIKRELNPKWDYWCEFIILDPVAQQLYFKLYDEDLNEDDFLGSGVVEIHHVIKENENDKWFTLDNAKRGKIHLRFTWLALSPDINDLGAASEETRLLKVGNISSAILIVYVDSAQNLPKVKQKKPDPYLILTVGKNQRKSKTKKHTIDPVWDQGFYLFVGNPESDSLIISAVDKQTDQKLDQFSYNICQLFHEDDLQISKKEFTFVESESKIILSLQLRVLKNAQFNAEESDTDSDDEILKYTSTVRESFKSPQKESISKLDSTPSNVGEMIEKAITKSITQSQSTLVSIARSPSFKVKQELVGNIELTLQYSELRQKLVVRVHRVSNLPLKDPDHIPDPYVRLKLVSTCSSTIKNKTKVVVDNCDPVYEEAFEYLLSKSELPSTKLFVSVKTKKSFFNSHTMGQIVIELKDFKNLDEPVRKWFDLVDDADSD